MFIQFLLECKFPYWQYEILLLPSVVYYFALELCANGFFHGAESISFFWHGMRRLTDPALRV